MTRDEGDDAAPGGGAERAGAEGGRGRLFWRLIGGGLFAIGLVGLVAPLLPTTIFWILAVLALQKADPAFAARIRAWPRVGPAVSAYLDHGVVTARGKLAAMIGMGASGAILALTLPPDWPLALALACLAAVSGYLLTRPSKPAAAAARTPSITQPAADTRD